MFNTKFFRLGFFILLFLSFVESSSAAEKPVLLTTALQSRMNYLSNNLVCYLPKGRIDKVPGRLRSLKKGAYSTIKRRGVYFLSRNFLNNQELKRSKKRKLSRARNRELSARLRNLNASESSLCNAWSAVTFRWFPSESAIGYYLYAESANAQILSRSEIVPIGCTHRATEGYTSGVCSFHLNAPPSPSTRVIRISAYNEKGESRLSQVILP